MSLPSRLIRYSTFGLAAAGFAAIVMVRNLQAQRNGPPSPEPPFPMARKPFENPVSATGIIEALSENIAIGVPEAGLVASVETEVQQTVAKGAVLFRLDDRDLRARTNNALARKEVAAARLAVAAAELAQAEARWKRVEAVADPRAVSRDDLENRRLDHSTAEARTEAARAELAAADKELESLAILGERLVIRAPRNGTVIQVNIRPGEYASTSPKQPAMILGDLTRLQVRADVDEQNATHIRAGGKGMANLKGDPSVTFPLEFVRIEPFVIPKTSLTGASTERVDTRVLQVIFSFARPASPPVYIGQQVDVFIERPQP